MFGSIAIRAHLGPKNTPFAHKPLSRKFCSVVEDGAQRDRKNVLYVKGLPADATWKLLKTHFEAVGPVAHVRIASNGQGKPKVKQTLL